MLRAIGSKKDLNCKNEPSAREFMECISDIYENEKVRKLDKLEQHNHTSRLQHSINVAYYSYVVCKKFGWDYRSAARAGILHDLYFYDWRKPSRIRGNHALWHPLIALDNARKITALNNVEVDAIRNHMWPCTIMPPKYKESYVLTFADKICATMEFFDGLSFIKHTRDLIGRFAKSNV